MAVWQWLVDTAGVVLFVGLAYGVLLVVRRRWLDRSGGTFELSLRLTDARAGRGWVLGVGRYDGHRLEWYRVFSIWPAPKRAWTRDDLGTPKRRDPDGPEVYSLYADHVVVVCPTRSGPVELSMTPAALTGLQAWLEGAPPGDPARKRR